MRSNNYINRKVLYIVLSIIVILVFTMSIAYAVLNVTLNIHGNASISAANWDVHLEKPIVKSGSVSTNLPVISNGTTASFNIELNTPGEFYQFSIDVVNDGDVDAMINSIEKTGLGHNQAKYLNYLIEYEDGTSIVTKQLLSVGDFVRLKVRVEYRTDLNASDLPATQEVLNLSFNINYTQSDGTNGIQVPNNGVGTSDNVLKLERMLSTYEINSLGETVITLDGDITFSEDDVWIPFVLPNDVDKIVINNDGCTISGLNAPLFAGVSSANIEINRLAVSNSSIISDNALGNGIIFEYVENSNIQINDMNFHDNSITGTDNVGGIIGWTSSSTVRIENPSVISNLITGTGNVGGVIGGTSSSDVTILNATVYDNSITSTQSASAFIGYTGISNSSNTVILNCSTNCNNIAGESGKTGVVAGTVGYGDVNIDSSIFDLDIINGSSSIILYGGITPGSTSKVLLDGFEI